MIPSLIVFPTQFVFEIGPFERVSAQSFIDVAFDGRMSRFVAVAVYTRCMSHSRIIVLLDACPVTVGLN